MASSRHDRSSAMLCMMIWVADHRNRLAMIPATIKSGHAVLVAQTPLAATTTARLPIASFQLQSQTERTFASPSRYFISKSTLTMLAVNASRPMAPMISA